MTTQISSANIQAGTLGSISGPKVTSIVYVGDDTAADVAGGQTITLNGSGFSAGATILVNGIPVSLVTFVNSNILRFTSPAMTAGGYTIYVINADGGTAISIPGIQYSGIPTWTTGAGLLTTVDELTAANVTLAATGDAPITYGLVSGTLPTGITLNSSTGVISGTAPATPNSTTYTFTIRATDAQNQDTNRIFNITVNPVPVTVSVEYLVVAGGGAGYGGGGGGGGILYQANSTLSRQTAYTITIGAGGSGSGVSGSDSSISGSGFTTATAVGGGGGAPDWTAGGSGGAGGGGGVGNTGGLGTAGQGNNGGAGETSGSAGATGGTGNNLAGGGGGGASYYNKSGGNGGNGGTYSISGTATTYAGGGGGCSNGYGQGAGGVGGGGAGKQNAPANPGADGLGGGGGGCYNFNPAGSGGGGTVIIRYADSSPAATSTTGSPTYTTPAGYRVYQFTTSGSITF